MQLLGRYAKRIHSYCTGRQCPECGRAGRGSDADTQYQAKRMQRQREKRQASRDIEGSLDPRSMLDGVPYPSDVWPKYFGDVDEEPFIPFGQWFEYQQIGVRDA